MFAARVFFVSAVLCCANASRIQEQGVAQRLWQQAWSDALDQAGLSNANVDSMPPELKESLQGKAVKLWKIALAQRQAAESTTTMEVATTTKNAAMSALLSGIDGNEVVDLSYSTTTTTTTTTTTEATTTTTTTTEDPEVKEKQREQLMQMHKNVMSQLTAGMGKDDLEDATTTTTEATTTETTTTTENKAMMALLAGVEPNVPVRRSSFLANPTTTTTTTTTSTTTEVTTTTEDPRVAEEREQQKQQLLEMHKNVMSKLTSGFADIDKEEATATTTTAAPVTTTTKSTTKNLAMLRLLDGVDGPAAQPKAKSAKKTTTTTTTTTTTETIGAAGRKTLAFITSGTFSFKPKPHVQEAAADQDDDSEEQDKAEPTDGGEAAADFDMDNNA